MPGSGTETFQGLSVLAGLMLSLGASKLVGQAASRLILTYSRGFSEGEYVCVADSEDTVTGMGMFVTRTEGVMREPAPVVFQTALSDWYPDYESGAA